MRKLIGHTECRALGYIFCGDIAFAARGELLVAKDAQFFERLIAELRFATSMADRETHPEAALRHYTRSARAILGDLDAGKKPGALRPGERDFRVSGVFFAAPARDHLILVADHDFPAEQRYLRISINDSRPGHTVRNAAPVVVPNTDVDTNFRKILSSARMGSAVYCPMLWDGQAIGMFNVAAQARGTFDGTDLQAAMLFADAATGRWMAKGGPHYIAGLADALGPWVETPVETKPPQPEDVNGLRAKLSDALARLLQETGGRRATLRIDDVRRGWSVEMPCAEAGAPGTAPDPDHHRTSPIARWLESNRRILDTSKEPGFHQASSASQAHDTDGEVRLAGPLVRVDGHVSGWISVYFDAGARPPGGADTASMMRAVDQVCGIIGFAPPT